VPTFLITDLPEVRVDFNSSSGAGLLRTSRVMNPAVWPKLAANTWVLAGDDDGNHCAARVSVVHDNWAELEPDWSTWLSSDDNPIVMSVSVKEVAISELQSLNSYVDLGDGFVAGRSGVFEPQRQLAAMAS
jgi:hypothetical protein